MAKKVRTIEMQRLTVEEFREAVKLPLVVVLDDVRSMHNVGSVLRTADTFRVEEVCLCGITSTPPSAEIHKTALGAEDSVSWHYFPTAIEAVRQDVVDASDGCLEIPQLGTKHSMNVSVTAGIVIYKFAEQLLLK